MEIDYGRLDALEAALGGRAAINAAFNAGKSLVQLPASVVTDSSVGRAGQTAGSLDGTTPLIPTFDQVALRRMPARQHGPEVTAVPRSVGTNLWVVDPALNGYSQQGHTNAAGNAAVSSDVALVVENVPSGTTTTFNAIQYPSVTTYPNGDVSSGTFVCAATGCNVSVRAEFKRLSRRAVRKRIYLTTDVATTVILNDGFIGTTTALQYVGWNDQITLQSQHMRGITYKFGTGPSVQSGVAWGFGVCDAYQARRHLGDTADTWWPGTTGGIRLTIGNNGGARVLAVPTTGIFIDIFYWACAFNPNDANSQRRELAMCFADANEIPEGQDEIVRMCAAAATACKSVTSPGGTTPVLHDSPPQGTGFPRGDAFAQFALRDQTFSAALLQRWFANRVSGSTNTSLNGTILDQLTDAGVAVGRWCDSSALALIWAAHLTAQVVPGSNAALTNGLTDAQRNALHDVLVAKDDGTGQLVFTRATDGSAIGHYDWYVVPSAISHFTMTQMNGYYACALLALAQLGYGATDATKITNATAKYAAAYDSSLGHLRFLLNTDTSTWLTYGSIIDLLPEWFAIFALGQPNGLLGSTITKACVNYFMANHVVNLQTGGRALKLMMQDGGQNYISATEMSSIAQGTYVNGGSQFLFDFVIASLGQYYGVPGMRSFWAERKRAETNVDFDVHEGLCLVSPSPAPSTDPYNSRNNSRNLPWNGIVAAFEKVSGLVD